MHEVSVEQTSAQEDVTFYVDGVDDALQINSVNAQDEGFVTVQLNGSEWNTSGHWSKVQCAFTKDFHAGVYKKGNYITKN